MGWADGFGRARSHSGFHSSSKSCDQSAHTQKSDITVSSVSNERITERNRERERERASSHLRDDKRDQQHCRDDQQHDANDQLEWTEVLEDDVARRVDLEQANLTSIEQTVPDGAITTSVSFVERERVCVSHVRFLLLDRSELLTVPTAHLGRSILDRSIALVDGLLLEAQERQLLLDVLLLSSDQSVSPSHESLGQIATYCLVVDSTASADQADRQSHQAIRLDTAATCQSQPTRSEMRET